MRMTYPLVVVRLADLERAQWLVVMFNFLHRCMYSFMWSGFLLKLRLVTWVEFEFGMMIHLAIWVRKVEMLPVKKQFFSTTPADL